MVTIMKTKIERAIKKVEEHSAIEQEQKALILEKLKEWKEEENAINDIAVKFESWWIELEPIFAELGLV
jgi:hypothetical protein